MKFYASPAQFIPALVIGTLVMGASALWCFFSGDAQNAAIGLLPTALLAGLYWWVWRQTRHPVVQTNGRHVQVRGTLGRDYDIEDISQYTLVVSTDWVGLRRKGQQDIMLDQNRFARLTWNNVVAHLKSLPFESTL